MKEARQARAWFKRPAVIIGGSLSVVIIGGWILSSIFLSKITINDSRVPAHVSDATLAAALNRQVDSYRLKVAYPDGKTKQYPLSGLGLNLDIASSLYSTRQNQHRLANRLLWWRPLPATVVLREDTAAFNNFIANQINVIVQPPQDAVLTIVNGNVQLADAVTGTRYGLAQPEQTLITAAAGLKPATIKLQTLKVNPALTAGLLAPYKAQLEKTINQPVSIKVGSQTVKPAPADIANWLDITPNDQTKKVDITVNSGKVAAYINKVAAAAIHPSRAQVDISGADSQVLVPGVNGVAVGDETAAATSVSQDLLKGAGLNLALPVAYQPFQTITAGDYPKWIEVDLTNKRLYAYEHANLVMTDLISAGAPATPTVTGQYAIYAKYVQQDMRGQNVDGSSYFQPHVPWVNYFYGGYAIHGNYWRPLSYFGNINSSHGCVGLMDGDAEWIYNWAPIGTPVITHT